MFEGSEIRYDRGGGEFNLDETWVSSAGKGKVRDPIGGAKKLSFHGKLLENSWTNFQQIRKEVLLARYLLRLGIFNGYGRAATYWIISYLLTVHE